jgi:hypothetical protein
MKMHFAAFVVVFATLTLPALAKPNPKPAPKPEPTPQPAFKTEELTVFRANCLRKISIIWSCGDNTNIYYDPGDQHAMVPAKDVDCKDDQVSKVPDNGKQVWRVDGCTYQGHFGHVFSCPSTPEGQGVTIPLTNKLFGDALDSCAEERQVLVK